MTPWASGLGDAYTERFEPWDRRRARWAWLRPIVDEAVEDHRRVHTVLEVGCGVGANLLALTTLSGSGDAIQATGLDVNPMAVEKANAAGLDVRLGDGLALPFGAAAFDLVLTCGYLIHLPPESLAQAVDELVRVSARWVLIGEYFAPTDEALPYQGHSAVDGLLFRRNYGRLFLARGLTCSDYGFVWKDLDELDNLTWWLFKKP